MRLNEVANKIQASHPLAEGREKGDLLSLCNEKPFVIDALDIIDWTDQKTGEVKDVAIFTVEEYPEHYFYGGTVVSDVLGKIKKAIERDEEAAADFGKSGLPAAFSRVKSAKNANQTYTAIELYPGK